MRGAVRSIALAGAHRMGPDCNGRAVRLVDHTCVHLLPVFCRLGVQQLVNPDDQRRSDDKLVTFNSSLVPIDHWPQPLGVEPISNTPKRNMWLAVLVNSPLLQVFDLFWFTSYTFFDFQPSEVTRPPTIAYPTLASTWQFLPDAPSSLVL